jgi:hypothetical protein
MSWRGTSGNYKARWTGYRPDRRAGRYAVRPCPRIVFIRPFQKTSEKCGKRKGNGVWFGAPASNRARKSETMKRIVGSDPHN